MAIAESRKIEIKVLAHVGELFTRHDQLADQRSKIQGKLQELEGLEDDFRQQISELPPELQSKLSLHPKKKKSPKKVNSSSRRSYWRSKGVALAISSLAQPSRQELESELSRLRPEAHQENLTDILDKVADTGSDGTIVLNEAGRKLCGQPSSPAKETVAASDESAAA